MATLEVVVLATALMSVAMVGVIVVYASRYRKVPPDHAMVLYGRKYQGGKGFEVWTGGGKFILPIVEAYKIISLEPFTFDHSVERAVGDVRGERAWFASVSVTGTARISPEVETLRAAAGQLVHKSRDEIRDIVVQTLEGHVRGLIATETRRTPDEVAIAEQVRALANADLKALGLEVLTVVVSVRPLDAPLPADPTAVEVLQRDLHQLSARLARVEAKLGLTTG